MHKLRTLHLFAGAGGGILADILLWHQPVGAVEIEPYCQQVLEARQKDGCLPWFPIFPDVKTFDGNPWRGRVDVVSGGFPCQDISAAGKGAGLDGSRSGLWAEMARIIGEVQPTYAWVENSPMLTLRGLDAILWDLAALGYDARWGVFAAADVGAQHKRERLWIMANANEMGRKIHPLKESWRSLSRYRLDFMEPTQFATNTPVLRSVDGVAHRVDRIKAIGNGQVPAVAALAWNILSGQDDMTHLQKKDRPTVAGERGGRKG